MRHAVSAILVVLLLGCSQAGTPLSPDGNGLTDSTRVESRASSEGKVLWGLFDVSIDPVKASIEIVPVRGTAFKANVTQFLQPPSGMPTWVAFEALDLSDFPVNGIIELDVKLTHPFAGLDQFRGFDVLGVFMADDSFDLTCLGPQASMAHGTDPDGDSLAPRLLNADGLTRWNNPTEFPSTNIFGFVPGVFGSPGFKPDATVNAYKYFADGLGSDIDLGGFFSASSNLANRGSFTPGSINTRHYKIQFDDPGSPLLFQYAILANWELPSNPENPELDDWSLQVNQAESFLIEVDTSESTVYYEDPDTKGGTVILEITVFDWQALDEDGGGIPVPDGISAIFVEAFTPGFIPGQPIDVLPMATASPDTAASSTFSVDLVDVEPMKSGWEGMVIAVVSENPAGYDQGFGVPVSAGPLAAVQVTWVDVLSEMPYNQAPSVGDITGETNPIEINIEEYEVVALDPDGDPLHYGWSLVDSGLPADWTQTWPDSATIIVDWSDYGPGDYDLHCRVKDDFNDWQLAANSPLAITVDELSITCGDGEFGYFDYAYTQCQQTESVFLSDGHTISEYGYSFTDREFEIMEVWYGWHQPGYCGQTNYEDECDDTWCEQWSDLFIPSTDPTNRSIHMDCDPNDTFGEGYETDDVVAFVMSLQSNVVRFIDGFDCSQITEANEVAARTIPYEVLAIDFDEDGDLWVLDSSGDTYELTKSSTYAVGTVEFNVDMDTVAPGTVVVFDWVISYLTGDLYIFTDETVGGTIHRISGTSGSILDTVSNALDAGISNPDYGLGDTGARGDIEIDHRIMTDENPLAENCRLVVGGGPGGTGMAGMFARYDQALELLSTWDNNKLGGGSCENYVGNDGARFIIFDPVEHEDDPLTDVDESECRHTMWAGDAGTGAGNLIWASSCRPIPDDWDGWG